MRLSDIIASRQYSFVYEADTGSVAKATNKGGRAGVPPNPLYGRVSKRAVYAGQAATAQMLIDAILKVNPNYQPSTTRAPQHEQIAENPCVVRSLSTGQLQVRILRPRTIKTDWLVDGKPATPAELQTIAAYKRARASDPTSVKVMFPYVENLSNVDSDLVFSDDED